MGGCVLEGARVPRDDRAASLAAQVTREEREERVRSDTPTQRAPRAAR